MRLRTGIIAAFLTGTALCGAPAAAQAARFYCYAFANADSDKLLRTLTQPLLYLTPVFESDEDGTLLEAEYSRSLPDAGIATCVSEEDEPDLDGSWQQLIDDSKAQGAPVKIMPLVDE